ncbi:hypothetical protein O181_011619 [Austropuccinia psidii MF-1]|uniref:Uncharacterized protein n=1 Tax=Austropuccinia psidii MF-1 TaxID=1389203 RepID=A0A9Q3BUT0_9BASI|nr:hypothetical protein [Austropuccinia psidii MF-1]
MKGVMNSLTTPQVLILAKAYQSYNNYEERDRLESSLIEVAHLNNPNNSKSFYLMSMIAVALIPINNNLSIFLFSTRILSLVKSLYSNIKN